MNDQLQQLLQPLQDNASSIAIVVVLVLLCRAAIRRWVRRAQSGAAGLDPTVVPALGKTVMFGVYVLSAVALLDFAGINSTGLVALLGASGLAVGLALRDTLSNIAAGFMILVLQPFRVGESIEVGSATGKVREIGIFVTVLDTPDGLYVAMPNRAILSSASIKNFTRNGRRRIELVIRIEYGDSIELALEALRNVLSDEPKLMDEPAPSVSVIDLGAQSVNLRARGWTLSADYDTTYTALVAEIKEQFERAGIAFAYTQRHVVTLDKSTNAD